MRRVDAHTLYRHGRRLVLAKPRADLEVEVEQSERSGRWLVAHLSDPVPLLLATWQADSSSEEDFDEETSRRGALGVLRAGELAELLGLSRGSMTVSLRPPP